MDTVRPDGGHGIIRAQCTAIYNGGNLCLARGKSLGCSNIDPSSACSGQDGVIFSSDSNSYVSRRDELGDWARRQLQAGCGGDQDGKCSERAQISGAHRPWEGLTRWPIDRAVRRQARRVPDTRRKDAVRIRRRQGLLIAVPAGDATVSRWRVDSGQVRHVERTRRRGNKAAVAVTRHPSPTAKTRWALGGGGDAWSGWQLAAPSRRQAGRGWCRAAQSGGVEGGGRWWVQVVWLGACATRSPRSPIPRALIRGLANPPECPGGFPVHGRAPAQRLLHPPKVTLLCPSSASLPVSIKLLPYPLPRTPSDPPLSAPRLPSSFDCADHFRRARPLLGAHELR